MAETPFDPITRRSLEQSRLGQAFRFVGRTVAFTFGAADTDTEVRHGVPAIPHGYLVLSSAGAITRVPGTAWTKDLAYLRSSLANDEVLLLFVVLKEEPLNVNP